MQGMLFQVSLTAHEQILSLFVLHEVTSGVN